jgi:diguanylate cyclase (GGDEF)-like protein
MRLLTYLDGKPPIVTAVIGAVLLALIGALDYATGPDLGLSIFYLAPILLVAHRSGKWPGLGMAILATLAWLGADIATGRQYSVPFVHYWNAAVRLGFFALIVLLLIALKREQLSARRDVLTGVGNRQILQEVLAGEIARAQRFRRPLSCALLDVDQFKSINDTFGHPAGDSVLRAIADRLLLHTRAIDTVIRFGGDEFVLILPETGAVPVHAAIRRIQGGLEGLTPPSADRRPVTFSIGIVTFERPPRDADEVLARADSALYAAKRRGGDAVEHDVAQ